MPTPCQSLQKAEEGFAIVVPGAPGLPLRAAAAAGTKVAASRAAPRKQKEALCTWSTGPKPSAPD
ncbi:hypothetical protein CBM2623_B30054 [Cupriavidus taiwanensis]|nr:hypothetical protein CBM2617_B50055 [Cupriavidus taiwanensis]SOZ88092.1 hypothetical protein CBM2618_B40056 [Cupriavidus taiwanensis]SOZ95237.1 hypothetical protein CBM2621_B40055 [Cupriavidus taiwanensis]SPA34407.1 hypothetical protein CBM2623_B30054 [Cupriavidus taiwanensis]SPD56115.1 protein of unknown function [Cupriavidus taiwanensis]